MSNSKPASSTNKSRIRTGYLEDKGDQLYYVLHESTIPVAQALLVGAFPSERIHSSIPWTRWARYLANSGVSALRFDFRGSGESTGEFRDQALSTWTDDIHRFIDFIKSHQPGLPLVLCGLDFGALLATNAFPDVEADALLVWSPPKSGLQALRNALLRRQVADMELKPNGPKKKWQDHVADLEQKGFIEVEGYPWSKALWDQAQSCRLALPDAQSERRPWRVVDLDKNAAPLVTDFAQWRALNPWAQVEPLPLNPDLSPLYAKNLKWILQAIVTTVDHKNEKVH